MSEESQRPDVPHCVVTPVANGYIVRLGRATMGEYYPDEAVYVARTYRQLCQVLKHVAVKAKLS